MGSCPQNSESSCQCDGVSSREGGWQPTTVTWRNPDWDKKLLFPDVSPLPANSWLLEGTLQLDGGTTKDLRLPREMFWPWVHPTCPQGQDLEETRPQTYESIGVAADWPSTMVRSVWLLWTARSNEIPSLNSHPDLVRGLTSLLTICTILKKWPKHSRSQFLLHKMAFLVKVPVLYVSAQHSLSNTINT